jgi:hypothetical protein
MKIILTKNECDSMIVSLQYAWLAGYKISFPKIYKLKDGNFSIKGGCCELEYNNNK